jgi:hypothetical protein
MTFLVPLLFFPILLPLPPIFPDSSITLNLKTLLVAPFPTIVVYPFFVGLHLSPCVVFYLLMLLFGALGCLVEDGPFHEVEKDASSMH